MDRVLSVRLNAALLNEMDETTRRLNISRKQFLEEAIRLHVDRLSRNAEDVWAQTLGAWKREENVEGTIGRAREGFRKGFGKNQGTS